jgi:glutaredoxin
MHHHIPLFRCNLQDPCPYVVNAPSTLDPDRPACEAIIVAKKAGESNSMPMKVIYLLNCLQLIK